MKAPVRLAALVLALSSAPALAKDASTAAEHATRAGLARSTCVATTFPPSAQTGMGMP